MRYRLLFTNFQVMFMVYLNPNLPFISAAQHSSSLGKPATAMSNFKTGRENIRSVVITRISTRHID